MRYWPWAILLLFLLSWGQGAGDCSYPEIWQLLSGGELSPGSRTILLQIRLPRLLAAFLAGAMLAAAGCATQNLFRNDLGSPHVLGVVNAAALGAVCGLLLGGWMMTPLGITFGLLTLLLLFAPGKTRAWDGAALILAGIAINAFTSALTSAALFLADERLNAMVFWLLGGFWRITWQDVLLLAPTAAIGCAALLALAPEMDMLLLGDRAASLAGVPLQRVKPIALLVVATLTAVVVSCCGVIGFVGLAVPHIARMLLGAPFRRLLPGAIMLGGTLLLLADLLARTAAAPLEIPVGILTALAGGPFFFYLLLRRGGAGQ